MLAAIEEAERIRDATGAWMPNQFGNPANPRVHYETTAPELWAQMNGRIDAFVGGSGNLWDDKRGWTVPQGTAA